MFRLYSQFVPMLLSDKFTIPDCQYCSNNTFFIKYCHKIVLRFAWLTYFPYLVNTVLQWNSVNLKKGMANLIVSFSKERF